MGSSLLITTRMRPEELRDCLKTVTEQTVPFAELVLVDSSEREQAEEIKQILVGSGMNFTYIPITPGYWRAIQLNIGYRATTGDPVFLIDDDTLLDPRFHEEILRLFKERGDGLGGVHGMITNEILGGFWNNLWRRIFFMRYYTKDRPGRMLPSGFPTWPVRPTRVQPTEVVPNTGIAYRRKVIEEFEFDEALEGHAWKEDIDFSYRVSRRYGLVFTPAARFVHLTTPTARVTTREATEMFVDHNYRLFKKNLPQTPLNRLAFAWAVLGLFIHTVVKSIVRRDSQLLWGTVDGIRKVLRSTHKWK